MASSLKDRLAEQDETLARLRAEQKERGLLNRIKELERSNRHALELVEKLESDLETIARLSELEKPSTVPVVPKSKKNEAIPLFSWSDWHVDERVFANKVQSKNRFDKATASARARKCCESTVKVLRHIREACHVSTVSLCLGGDFITGEIHEELAQTNTMGQIEACLFAARHLADGLAMLDAEPDVKTIHVSCVVGNHGRFTKRMQYKNGAEKNFETFIYAILRDQFSSPKFRWSVAAGGINYTRLTPWFTVRDFHGHQIKYQGGIGGLTIPLIKWLHRQNQNNPAHFNRMHHFHTFSQPAPGVLVNGSLKGWDEYAAEHGFAYEPPTQACAVLDCDRRRISAVHPIYCE